MGLKDAMYVSRDVGTWRSTDIPTRAVASPIRLFGLISPNSKSSIATGGASARTLLIPPILSRVNRIIVSNGQVEAQNYAAEIKLRAQRKEGEIPGEMDKHEGGRPVDNPFQPERGYPPQAGGWSTLRRGGTSSKEEYLGVPLRLYQHSRSTSRAHASFG